MSFRGHFQQYGWLPNKAGSLCDTLLTWATLSIFDLAPSQCQLLYGNDRYISLSKSGIVISYQMCKIIQLLLCRLLTNLALNSGRNSIFIFIHSIRIYIWTILPKMHSMKMSTTSHFFWKIHCCGFYILTSAYDSYVHTKYM